MCCNSFSNHVFDVTRPDEHGNGVMLREYILPLLCAQPELAKTLTEKLRFS